MNSFNISLSALMHKKLSLRPSDTTPLPGSKVALSYWGKNSSNPFEGIGNFGKTAKDI